MCFRVNEGMSLQDPSYPFYIWSNTHCKLLCLILYYYDIKQMTIVMVIRNSVATIFLV